MSRSPKFRVGGVDATGITAAVSAGDRHPTVIHLVRLSLVVDDDALTALAGPLSADEHGRAERMAPTVRRRYVACRGRLRQLLGGLLGAKPDDVVFSYGTYGKPAVASPAGGGWRFNLSHSGDVAVMALSRRDVGIDIECVSREHHAGWGALMAPAILHADEQRAWSALPSPSRLTALLDAWVAKEAVLKAMGRGLALGPRLVMVPLPAKPEPIDCDAAPRTVVLQPVRYAGWDDPSGPSSWHVANVTFGPGERVAFACTERECLVHLVDSKAAPVAKILAIEAG